MVRGFIVEKFFAAFLGFGIMNNREKGRKTFDI